MALIGATCLLAACGQKAASSDPSETASAPDADAGAPTPAQAKALLASMPAPFNAADPDHGRHIFAQCAACHTNTKGGPNMTGPNLYGLLGRTAGSVADYDYSYAVKNAGFTWDAGHLNAWLTGPQAMLAGTKMSFAGLKSPQDRADVIAYLKVSTTPVGP